MSSTFEARLRKYANLAIRSGVALQKGQELIIGADVAEVAFVRLLAEEAYKAGADNVFTYYGDEPTTLSRYEFGTDIAVSHAPKWFIDALAKRVATGEAAFFRVVGGNPALLQGIDPVKVAANARAQAVANHDFIQIITSMKSNLCLMGFASPAWAKMVFPNDTSEIAVSKLWDAIFKCCAIDEPDPVAAWAAHCDDIGRRRDQMTVANYAALHFKGGGTDLTVGLAEGGRWAGGGVTTKNGVFCSPNVPTEEIFAMPHRLRVDGVVRSTKPLSVRGTMIDGIEMTFEKGKVIKASARQGEDTLRRLLDTDEGASYLGEVALVPQSSRVAQANILFFNTLYDENAACHIAVGQALGHNLEGFADMSEEERKSRGANSSMVHVDWMIGSGEIDVDGIKQDGSRVPVMRAGEWAF